MKQMKIMESDFTIRPRNAASGKVRPRPSANYFFNATILTLILLFAVSGWAQTTFGSFLGAVRDPSGAVIANATVSLTNRGTSAKRSAATDQSGSYVFVNVEPGTYDLAVEAPGFQRSNFPSLILTARQTVRVDAALVLGTQAETVTVQEAAAAISTDVSNLAETKTGRELVDLPVAISSRGSGSTSPISTLTTQPGVLTDNSGNLSVAGAKPSMLSVSLDGISTMSPRDFGVIPELFPSFSGIAEIRVSAVNNPAEFGGASDITTISRGGTNQFHGGLFENNQAAAYDAKSPFATTRPQLVMNDFGAYLGGPVSIPHLYNGHDKTFLFATYEGLRLPAQTTLVESVPTLALRSGDLSAYHAGSILDPLASGAPFAGNQIPISRIASLSQNALQYLFPTPNYGAPNAIANNYEVNSPTPVTSNQGDIRLDQNISPRQTAFARFTYKRRLVDAAPTGTPLAGPSIQPENDYALTVAYNFIINSRLVNELRGGLTGYSSSNSFGIVASTIQSQLGLRLPGQVPAGNEIPDFNITGFQATDDGESSVSRTRTVQLIDNLTYTHGRHDIKVGGDIRYLSGFYNNNWGNNRMGEFDFINAATRPIIGNPFAAFLLGVPDSTDVATVTEGDANAHARHYGFYGQDNWKIASRLTLNFGLRWEYHPMFTDSLNNVGNFLPNYYSIVNGQTVHGAVVVPDARINGIDSNFAGSISPTPILTATQAGLPQSLRNSDKNDFAPRFGFAWRPADKTVIRGGYGRFIETELGHALYANWGIPTGYFGQFTNTIVNGKPTLTFPYPFPSNLAGASGTADFLSAVDTNYKDPYVQQWNLTVERDLGHNIGVRVSYDGSHGTNLGNFENANQVPANTVGFATAEAAEPYPLWSFLKTAVNASRSNYNALTVAATKRLSKGLQFQSSYVYAKNLSNEGGRDPSAFASELGGILTDKFKPNLDYGNVAFTRRNRFLTTFLYDLPFGRNQTFLTSAGSVLNRIVGGWEVAGVLLFQTGPFLTVVAPGSDPAGDGFDTVVGTGRADIVSGQPLYPAVQNSGLWINKAAFAVPPDNVGRGPSSPVGAVVGPGTQAVSLSLFKSVQIAERVRFQFGAAAANALNHLNLGNPALTYTAASFGTITSTQTAEGAAPRSIQLSGRITF